MQIIVNGVPLLDGQAKAVAIALAELEVDLAAQDGLSIAEAALLQMVREVRELIPGEREKPNTSR